MCLRDLAKRRAAIEIFVAIPFAAGDPPGCTRVGDREFGQLFADIHVAQLRLIRELVAEPDAVVERTEHDGERALRRIFLDQSNAQLVVAVANIAPLAPRLFPRFVDAACLHAVAAKIALQFRGIGQPEPEPRFADDLAAAARNRIAGTTLVVDRDTDGENVAG